MTRRPGRPPKAAAAPGREAILAEALRLLDTGPEALTMRALAARLGLTPMSLYPHFGDRDGLVRALADRAYAAVAAPPAGTPRGRIAALLLAYQAQVLRHPALALEIFRSPAAFPAQAARISDTLTDLLRQHGLAPDKALLWRDILIDFTHGAALATALGGEPGAGYAPTLDALLAALPAA